MINGSRYELKGSTIIDHDPVAVILAAGRGNRMGIDKPKVAVPLAGKPLLLHVVANLAQAGFRKQVIVVGYRHAEVEALFQNQNLPPHFDQVEYRFVMQEQQRGTAHALLCTKEELKDHRGPLLVTCGDMPLISSTSFASLLRQHRETKCVMSLLSAKLKVASGYGRIIRGSQGELTSIVEEKDASAEQRKIDEVNTATYVFGAPQIFDMLQQIRDNNIQSEYYLPDVVSLYRASGRRVEAFPLANSWEACGINSFKELDIAEKLFAERNQKVLQPSNSILSRQPLKLR